MEVNEEFNISNLYVPKNIKEQKILSLSKYSKITDAIINPEISEIDGESAVIVLFRKIEHEGFTHKEYPYKLNLVGALVWEKLKEKMTIEEIAKEISELFDVEYLTTLRDIKHFIKELIKEQLIIVSQKNE